MRFSARFRPRLGVVHSPLRGLHARHRVYGAPAYISATNPSSLTEANLNGATVTVSLGGLTFASGVSASSFALVTSPSIAGLTIANVTGGARTVTVTAQDANRAVGDRDTLTFQVTALDNPTLAASPTTANPAPLPTPPPVV